ncbi:hypothetical protein [Riemerella anatipestifer]|nr:hypothetical protein [Riemerella anatipestifer]MCW0498905.1 hypothetical protein [Riemerella anatipestifer]UWS41262.1 hypothetical protein N1F80_01800 [Riemerella anatipestifer]
MSFINSYCGMFWNINNNNRIFDFNFFRDFRFVLLLKFDGSMISFS